MVLKENLDKGNEQISTDFSLCSQKNQHLSQSGFFKIRKTNPANFSSNWCFYHPVDLRMEHAVFLVFTSSSFSPAETFSQKKKEFHDNLWCLHHDTYAAIYLQSMLQGSTYFGSTCSHLSMSLCEI